MKIMFRVLSVIGVLVIVGGIVSILLPGYARVASSTVVDAPAKVVFEHLKDFQRWKDWNVWDQRNAQAGISTSNPSSGVDAWHQWKDKANGEVKALITYQEPDQSLYYRLLFEDRDIVGIGSFKLFPDGNKTRVDWRIDDKLGLNPLKRVFGLLFAVRTGGELDAGLASLKKLSENTVTR
jgi:hypothetical protein